MKVSEPSSNTIQVLLNIFLLAANRNAIFWTILTCPFYLTDRDMADEEQLLGDDDAYDNEALMNGQEDIDNGDILNGENGEPKVSRKSAINSLWGSILFSFVKFLIFLKFSSECLGIR